MRKIFVLIALACSLLVCAAAQAAQITDVKWGVNKEEVLRFVVDLTDNAGYAVDIEGSVLNLTVNASKGSQVAAQGNVKSVLATSYQVVDREHYTIVRVPLRQSLSESHYKSFTLKQDPQTNRPFRVVLDIMPAQRSVKAPMQSTAKAISLMFTGRSIQGGSTLTQQLIKNMTSDDEVTVKRKVMEIFRALEFEKKYTKDDILEAYLNYIYLGQGCNGVYTAAYTYFGKHVSELDLAECACLIGITNNPSKYDPLGHLSITDPDTGEVKTSKDFNKERQMKILDVMLEQGYITQEEHDQAAAEELVFSNPYEDKDGDGQADSTKKKNTVYSWYVDQVINDVIQDLCDKYNWSEQYAKTKVFSGGLEIYTCMNPNVQAAVDAVYSDRSNLDKVSKSGQQIKSAMTIVARPEKLHLRLMCFCKTISSRFAISVTQTCILIALALSP